jgi:hypothetical protein
VWGGVCDALAVLSWRLRGDFYGEVLECLVERHCEVVYVCWCAVLSDSSSSLHGHGTMMNDRPAGRPIPHKHDTFTVCR